MNFDDLLAIWLCVIIPIVFISINLAIFFKIKKMTKYLASIDEELDNHSDKLSRMSGK